MVPTMPPTSTVRSSYPEASKGPMALPIVLLRDKNQDLSHEQCLLASFGHMANLLELRGSEDWELEWRHPWDRWKIGKFRKIVKRANPQRFAGLAQDPQSIHSLVQIGDEAIELLSFPPYYLSDPDPRVKPLQVAGLEYPERGELIQAPKVEPKAGSGLILAYDGSLGATTGKMMAQAAHGAQLLKLREPSWKFSDESIRVVDSFDQPGVEWIVDVVDAGFTEVAPNSTTVKVGRATS